MHKQLMRAKRRTDTQDIELAMDLMVVFSKNSDDRNADHAILERLANKLELHTIADLKEETVAVQKLVKGRGQNAESLQQIKDLLEKFQEIAGFDEDSVLDSPVSSKSLQRCPSSLIPHEFLCPITLEIMTDPVIVASGQVISFWKLKLVFYCTKHAYFVLARGALPFLHVDIDLKNY